MVSYIVIEEMPLLVIQVAPFLAIAVLSSSSDKEDIITES